MRKADGARDVRSRRDDRGLPERGRQARDRPPIPVPSVLHSCRGRDRARRAWQARRSARQHQGFGGEQRAASARHDPLPAGRPAGRASGRDVRARRATSRIAAGRSRTARAASSLSTAVWSRRSRSGDFSPTFFEIEVVGEQGIAQGRSRGRPGGRKGRAVARLGCRVVRVPARAVHRIRQVDHGQERRRTAPTPIRARARRSWRSRCTSPGAARRPVDLPLANKGDVIREFFGHPEAAEPTVIDRGPAVVTRPDRARRAGSRWTAAGPRSPRWPSSAPHFGSGEAKGLARVHDVEAAGLHRRHRSHGARARIRRRSTARRRPSRPRPERPRSMWRSRPSIPIRATRSSPRRCPTWARRSRSCSPNCIPVFADIDPITGNLTAETIAKKITPRTRAVIVVHLFGRPADLGPIVDLLRAEGHRADRGLRAGALRGVPRQEDRNVRRPGLLQPAAVEADHLRRRRPHARQPRGPDRAREPVHRQGPEPQGGPRAPLPRRQLPDDRVAGNGGEGAARQGPRPDRGAAHGGDALSAALAAVAGHHRAAGSAGDESLVVAVQLPDRRGAGRRERRHVLRRARNGRRARDAAVPAPPAVRGGRDRQAQHVRHERLSVQRRDRLRAAEDRRPAGSAGILPPPDHPRVEQPPHGPPCGRRRERRREAAALRRRPRARPARRARAKATFRSAVENRPS